MNKNLKKELVAWSFIAPNFIGFLVFTLVPVVLSLALSFTEWDASAKPPVFVGLNNFKEMLTDDTFILSFKNTILFAVVTIPFTMAASLALALLLNQKIRGRNLFRSVFFFPHVASLVAIAVVWNMLFHPTMGPINALLFKIGIENPPGWTASVDWALPAVMIVSIWKGMGYYMVIYLAGLQGIPRELYEAAKVDGASSWKRFTSITLPMLTPTTFFVSVMLTISAFKVFDLISVMTQGGPGRATNVLVYHIYNSAFIYYRFGYASAISMVLFIMVAVITIVQFRMEKKWVSHL